MAESGTYRYVTYLEFKYKFDDSHKTGFEKNSICSKASKEPWIHKHSAACDSPNLRMELQWSA